MNLLLIQYCSGDLFGQSINKHKSGLSEFGTLAGPNIPNLPDLESWEITGSKAVKNIHKYELDVKTFVGLHRLKSYQSGKSSSTERIAWFRIFQLILYSYNPENQSFIAFNWTLFTFNYSELKK